MKLTKTQLATLRYVLKTQIEWGAGGCFGNGNEITQKRDFTIAQHLVKKIDEELSKFNLK